MKNMFFNSVLVAFVLLVASCSKQPEAKVDVMSFNIRLDHVADSLNNWTGPMAVPWAEPV